MITALKPEQVDFMWPLCDMLLEPLVNSKERAEIFVKGVAGNVQIWLVGKLPDVTAVFVTSVKDEGEGKVLVFNYFAGTCNREGRAAVNDALWEMQEHVGARRLELKTDRKIARLLKGYGCRPYKDQWRRN